MDWVLEAMAIIQTGYAEIDHQHVMLDELAVRLAKFCDAREVNSEAVCANCTVQKQRVCRSALAQLLVEIEAFLIGHSRYEEKLMELLPDTPSCREHIVGHRAAHDGIVRQMKRLSVQIAKESPLAGSVMVYRVFGHWLGDHTSRFDKNLAQHLGGTAHQEIDFDGELVAMLDRHVFTNRPTQAKPPASSLYTLRKTQLEVRGRFETLTAAQRKVFWLVVSGNKNIEIANELDLTVNTIKSHRAAIFQKMGVSSVLELVKLTDVLR